MRQTHLQSGSGDQVTDYAHTVQAARNRLDKAHRLARWAWTQGLTAEQVDLLTDQQWAALARRAIDRQASDATRGIVHALLVVKEAWAAANPGHQDAQRDLLTDEQVAALTRTRR
jgi:hypothetical protein